MKDILDKIEEIIRKNDKKYPEDMVFRHSYEEFRRICLLLKRSSYIYEGIYLLPQGDEKMMRQYLARLKKIREFFFEVSPDKSIPHCLRGPHLYSGEIIKVRRESRGVDRETLHIHYSNCKVRHLEDDSRMVIHIIPEDSKYHLGLNASRP